MNDDDLDSVTLGDLIREVEAARTIKVAPATLRNWRADEIGPPFVKLGHSVFYKRDIIEKFAAAYRYGMSPRDVTIG